MERVEILGLPVDPVDLRGLLDAVGAFIEAGLPRTVAYLNVHVANTAARDEGLRDFLDGADLVYCDGGGIRLGARLLGVELPERMTGADWIWDLAERAEGSWRIFWLGGEPGVTQQAAERLRERFPALQVDGDHGFYPDHQVPGLLERINAFQPDIVLVGMGTPLQERWVIRHREGLDAPVVWVLGATADFVSGKTSRGPEFLHQNQEWLARLLTEPRRLWKRYLLGNSAFLGRVALARLRAR